MSVSFLEGKWSMACWTHNLWDLGVQLSTTSCYLWACTHPCPASVSWILHCLVLSPSLLKWSHHSYSLLVLHPKVPRLEL